MSELLAGIYSRSDAFKRRLVDALRNPRAALEQRVGQMNDDARGFNELTYEAAAEPRLTGPKSQALAMKLAESYNPVGMTKVVGPRAEALETARKNAVKMLGLPENNTPMDRAKALGFDIEAFHGTNKVQSNASVSSGMGNGSDLVSSGNDLVRSRGDSAAIRSLLPGGTWFHKDPSQAFASGEGSYVIPSMIRLNNPIQRSSYFGMEDFSNPARFKYFDKAQQKFVTPDGVIGDNGVVVAFNPNQVRSRFAAFDPARVNENDLLGRADPKLLAALAGGTAATVAALRSRKDDDRKKKDKDE